MNVDKMRKWDYYAGVPLCFLGTLWKKLCSLIVPARKDPGPRNVLFIELSEMGSTILADPAMRKIGRALNANLFFAIFVKNKASLGLLKTIPAENIFVMPDDGLLDVAAGAIRYFVWTRKMEIDTVIDLELFSRFTALLTGFSGAVRRIGFHAFYNEGLYRGDFLTHKVAYNPHLHVSKNFIALADALLSDQPEIPYSKKAIPDAEIFVPRATVSKEASQDMAGRIRLACPVYDPEQHAIILLNTNASDLVPLRRWPREYYIRLARMILSEYQNVVILLTGATEEAPDLDAFAETVQNERCVNFAGRTTIAELPALYAESAFMLTNDSGPAHFASVTNMPTFVLFGPETPKAYGPLGNATVIYAGLACSPCVSAANHRKSPCNNNRCLQVITPEDVFRILEPSLKDIG
jgi:ADP-heptose:LPS heptosyltransferase